MSSPTQPIPTSFSNIQLICALDPTHALGKRNSRKDPLCRKLTLPDGSRCEEVMRLCNACYSKAFAEKQTQQGLKCDVDPTHNLGKSRLTKDPLGRNRTLPDGSASEEVMKLCNTCYSRAFAEKQSQQGFKCDIDPTHNLGKRRLTKDPLGRKKNLPDGSASEEVMKLCNACYLRTLKNKKLKNTTLYQEQRGAFESPLFAAADVAAKMSDAEYLGATALLELAKGHQEPAVAFAAP